MGLWQKIFKTDSHSGLRSGTSAESVGETQIAEAERHMNDRNYEKAAQAFAEALAHGSKLLKVHIGLAQAYEELRRYDDMRKCCEAAVRRHPDSYQAQNLLGAANAYLGDYPQALTALQRAIQLEPSDADSYSMLGRALIEMGTYLEALAPLKKAIELQPHHPEAEFKLANAYYQLGDYEAAIVHYKSYAKRFSFPWVSFNLGVAYYQAGHESEAVEHLKAAVAKGHKEAATLLAQIESNSATPQSTPASDEQVSSSDYRRDPFIASCLDIAYRELPDPRLFSHFKEIPQIDSLRNSGKTQEALSLCQRGIEKYSDSFLFYGRAAALCDRLNKPEEAERILMEGLSKSLSKCRIAGAIADRAFAKGNYRDAIRWWIAASVLQLESKIMVYDTPFLNLAYVCQPIGIKETSRWLLDMADRASHAAYGGPVRFNAEAAELRYQVARSFVAAKDNVAQYAIVAFHERYK
jgi:tetratricopeptide (TPR) repeat protein